MLLLLGPVPDVPCPDTVAEDPDPLEVGFVAAASAVAKLLGFAFDDPFVGELMSGVISGLIVDVLLVIGLMKLIGTPFSTEVVGPYLLVAWSDPPIESVTVRTVGEQVLSRRDRG